MKFRTFMIIAVVVGVIYAVASIFLANAEVLQAHQIRIWGGSLTVGMALVLAFAGGATIVFLIGLSRQVGLAVERWRIRKASRKSEEIEEEYSRGLVGVLEGRQGEAMRHFRAVLERDSRHFNTLIKLGEVLRDQEKYDEAIEYHQKAHHLKEDNTEPLYALVDDYEAKGDMDRARARLNTILAINKNSVAAWRKLRALHMKEDNWDKALEAHERVVKLSGTDQRFGEGIRYEIACAQLEAGKSKEAIAALRRLLAADDQFIPAHLRLGRALLLTKHESEAIQAWYRGFEVTGSPIFLAELEEHYLAQEQPLAAIEALKSCVARGRKDTLPRFYLGKLYFRLEMLDDAHSVLASLVGRANYAPTLHYLLGRIHERRSNHRDAALEYRKVIRETELVRLEYGCQACGETTMEWVDRCPGCGEWNSTEIDFHEEIPLEELGLAPAPVYPSGG